MVLAGDAVAHAGFGLVFPFLVIYLNQGRGLSLPLAGLCLGVLALGDFAAGPVAGAIADRVGARRVLIASVLLTGAATAALSLVGSAWQALSSASPLSPTL